MPNTLKTAALGRTKLFEGLSDVILDAIACVLSEVSYKPNQTIFLRGDDGGAIYIVVKGRVRLSVLTAHGRELSFTHARPGDVFGEIAVIDRSPRSADATALTDVHAFVLATVDFERLVSRFPPLAAAVMRFLCSRLREVSEHLEDIALLPLEARVARYFVYELQRNGAVSNSVSSLLALGISQTEGASQQNALRRR
jgi:CRP/FNR family transcriptional regulator, cyclic AMP receptor protein